MAKSYDVAFKLGAKLNKNYSGTFRKASDIAGQTVDKIKKTVVAIGSLVLSASAVSGAINTYKGFEQSMTNTAAISGIERTSEEYAKLEQAALDAGKATTKTAQEAADALGYMALAGWDVTTSTQALMPVLRLSEATRMDLALASDMVTDTMSALGIAVDETALGVDGLTGYLDLVAKAQNSSNMTAQQLMDAYLGVGGTMKSLNVPMEESAAILGLMANRGTKGAEAGNSLNSILANLTAPAGKAKTALDKLGYSAFDSEGNFLGLEKSLLLLQEKLADANDEQMQYFTSAIGGKTQLTELQQILDGLGDEYYELKGTILDNEGALETMAETMNDTLEGALALLSSAFSDLQIQLVKGFAPALKNVISGLADTIPKITDKLLAAGSAAKGFVNSFVENAKQQFKLVELYESLEPKMPWIQHSAKYFATNLLSGIKGFLAGDSLSDAFGESMLGLQGVFVQVFGKEAGDIITGGIQGKLDLVSSKIEVLRSAAAEIKASFAESFSGAGKALESFAVAIGGVFGSLNGANFTVFSAVAEGLKDIFLSALPILGQLVEKVMGVVQELAPVVSFIFDSVGALVETALPVIVGVIDGILSGVGPLLDGIFAIIGTITDAVRALVDKIKEYLPELQPVMESAASVLGEFGSAAGLVFAKIGETLEMLAPVFERVFGFVIKNVVPVAMVILKNLGKVFQTVGGVISRAVSAVAKVIPVIAVVLMALWDSLEPVLQTIANLFQFVFGFISGAISNAVDIIGEHMDNAIAGFSGLIDFISGVFTGDWEKAWEGIKSIFSSIANSLVSIIKTPINAIIAIINSCIDGINSLGITIPDWVPKFGGNSFSLNIPQIPMLAKGSDHSPDTFIAGEQGAELITGNAGRKVFTAFETGNIFNNIGKLGSLMADAQNGKRLKINDSAAVNSGGGTVLNLTYAPQIKVGADSSGGPDLKGMVEALLQQDKENLRRIVLDIMEEQEVRRMRLANA